MIIKRKCFDLLLNSLNYSLRKCMKISQENNISMHIIGISLKALNKNTHQ